MLAAASCVLLVATGCGDASCPNGSVAQGDECVPYRPDGAVDASIDGGDPSPSDAGSLDGAMDGTVVRDAGDDASTGGRSDSGNPADSGGCEPGVFGSSLFGRACFR